MSGGHLCKAEAPTEAGAEKVDFAKQKTEGVFEGVLLTPSVTCGDSSLEEGALKMKMK